MGRRAVTEPVDELYCDGCNRFADRGQFLRLPDGWIRFDIRTAEDAPAHRGWQVPLDLCPPCQPNLYGIFLREIEMMKLPPEVRQAANDGEQRPRRKAVALEDFPGAFEPPL